MKRIILTSKFLVIAAGVSLVSLVLISTTTNQLAGKQSSLFKLTNGMNICFQRVNQTFTALMIKDLTSDFVQPDFRQTTGECFSQLASSLGAIVAKDSQVMGQLNNMMSDVHWFSKKVTRAAKLAQEDNVGLQNSNIIRKYEDIEGVKISIEEGLMTQAASIDGAKSLAMVGMILSQIILLLSIAGLFLKKKLVAKSIEDVEKMITDEAKRADQTILAQKALKQLFEALEAPQTQAFVSDYVNTIIEENYRIKDHLIKANTIGNREDISAYVAESKSALMVKTNEDCDFNHSLNAVLDRVREKAFNHGIMLDVDVSDNFHVKSNAEALDQFLFYMISYAMDSSLEHNQGRKVLIKGKPLGGIAYCKLRIAGHAFSDDDFAVINGKDPHHDTNINLVLLKELIVDSGARLAVKNKNSTNSGVVESEIEVIFDRAAIDQTDKKANKVNVLKGTKKELESFFKSFESQA